MKMLFGHRNLIMLIFAIMMLIYGVQGMTYAQEVNPTITASTPQPLTEATLHGSFVTLTLSGSNYERSTSSIRNALTVSGIEGVTIGRYDVDRVSDTKVTVELTFAGNIDADTPLVFTVGASGIATYDGAALTSQLPVTAVEESLTATTEFPLTEATLSGSIVTLTLSGRSFPYWESDIRVALSVSGIEGVTFSRYDVDRISTTKVTVELTFSGNIDTDATLILTVGANAIVGYNKGFTFELPVTAVEESLTATTEFPLTEATLSGSIVTLALSGRSFTDRELDIMDTLSISGIEGFTLSRSDVNRVSDTKVTVELTFSGNIDTDATLILTVGANAIVGYNKGFTFKLPVTAVEESLSATTEAPLTEATLSGSIITLALSGRSFPYWESDIIDALSVSGIEGVTVSRYGVNRISATKVTVELTFAGNIDTDSTLTLTVGAEAIGHNKDFTVTLPVLAVANESLSATTEAPLTEENLDGSIITLTLTGRRFAGRIRDALTISGIEGATVSESYGSIELVSNTKLNITLAFSGNIDTDATLTLTVGAEAIGYNKDFTFNFPVTAVVDESLTATTKAPLTEANLNGNIITLTLTGRRFADGWDIQNALTISGIEGATVSESYGSIELVSNTKLNVTLAFSGNIDTDATLTLTVGAEAIGYNKDFTFNFPVTAVVDESLTATTKAPLTEATLDGSIITLTLTGRRFAGSWTIEDALTFSGIEGVTVSESYLGVSRISDTEATVELAFAGNIDMDGILTLTVGADAINYNKDFTFNFPVTAVEESLDASTEFPLTEANLNGSIITLTLSGRQFADRRWDTDIRDFWDIRDALTLSGIEGATISDSYFGVRRVSDTEVKVTLAFYGDFDTDGELTLTVGADAINYNKDFTFNFPVTAVEQSDATVSISPSPIALPGFLEKLTLNLDIADGKNVAGYQATVSFDDSVLRYVESANGDYLPADAFFRTPTHTYGSALIAGNTLAKTSNGDGTLATITFEVVGIKPVRVTLSDVYLVDAAGKRWEVTTKDGEVIKHPDKNGEVIEPPELVEGIFGDLNLDGVVNIQDLVIVSNRFGWRGHSVADVSGDGLVNIVDLVLVAAAIEANPAAPTLHSDALEIFTAADLQQWLSQAQHLKLTDTTSQRGVLFLEQLLAALMPKKTVLLANYPNPFNPETWIPYHLSKDAEVTLHIYAIDGTQVRRLTLGHQPVGMYQTRSRAAYWDGKNAFGETVASGVYFYTLTAGNFTATRKMLIRK